MAKSTAIHTLFTDAYSFSYYGARNWQACIDMLFRRGYNAIEVECIMRSKLTRLAADGRIPMSARFAAPRDLARLLDSLGSECQSIVDDYVLGIMTEGDAPAPRPSRGALRLVWSR